MKISASSLQAVPWRNGLGLTRDIAIQLGPDGALLWQVSIADLVQDAPFSHYPDCDRIFTPIAGDPPPELAFHGGPFEPCPLLVPQHFAGDWPTLSRIPSPGRAFNVFVDRRRHSADVAVHRMAAGGVIERPVASAVILHCLSGLIATAGEQFGPGDSLTDPGPAPFQALQPGIALVVAIQAI